MRQLFGQRTVLGFDLGEYSLRCASVEPETGRVRGLHSVDLVPGRESKTDELDPASLEKRLRAVLPECQQKCTPWQKNVAVVLPPRSGACGYQEFPGLSDKELDLAVPSKVSKLIPFPLPEVAVSYRSVPMLHPKERQRGVLYVAVQKSVLLQVTGLLQRLGLKVSRAELPAVPLAREFHRNQPDQAEDLVALVHAGFRSSVVAVVRGGIPYHSRTFSMGGVDFTYAFQMGSQSTWPEAEAYKHAYDWNRREPSIEPFLTRWMEEVRKTVTQFERRFSSEEARVARVVLSGGDSVGPGLVERLAEHLKLPVEGGSWNALQAPHPVAPGRYKIAVGLALAD